MPLRYVVLCMLLAVSACTSANQPSAPMMVAASAEEKALLTKGDVARSLGRGGEAQEYYEQAAALSQGAVRAHLELAGMYETAGRQNDALDILQRAYALNPQSVEVLKGLAQQQLRKGNDASAVALATEGLALSPEDVRLLNVRGIAHDRAGDHAAAQQVYEQALAVLTGNVDREYTVNNLALSYIASGHYDKAIALAEPELPKAQNKTVLRQLLALAYGAKGDADRAYELGLMDLNVAQVRDNLAFYRQLGAGEVDSAVLFQPAGS